MRSSLVVRASDCQFTSCNGPGFDPSIRRNLRGSRWSSAEYCVKKNKKNPPQKKKIKKNLHSPFENSRKILLFVKMSMYIIVCFSIGAFSLLLSVSDKDSRGWSLYTEHRNNGIHARGMSASVQLLHVHIWISFNVYSMSCLCSLQYLSL